jgi:hypothetical protein
MHFNSGGVTPLSLTDKEFQMQLSNISYKGIVSGESKTLSPQDLKGHIFKSVASKVTSVVMDLTNRSFFPGSSNVPLIDSILSTQSIVGDALKISSVTVDLSSGNLSTYLSNITFVLTNKTSSKEVFKVTKLVNSSTVDLSAADLTTAWLETSDTYAFNVSANLNSAIGMGNNFIPRLSLTSTGNASLLNSSFSSQKSGRVSIIEAKGSLSSSAAVATVFPNSTTEVHKITLSDTSSSVSASVNVSLSALSYIFLDASGNAMDMTSVSSIKIGLRTTTGSVTDLYTTITPSSNVTVSGLSIDLASKGRELFMELTMKDGVTEFAGNISLGYVGYKFIDNSNGQIYEDYVSTPRETQVYLSTLSIEHNGSSSDSFHKNLVEGNVFDLVLKGTLLTPIWSVNPSSNVTLTSISSQSARLTVTNLQYSGNITVSANIASTPSNIIISRNFIIAGASPLTISSSGNSYTASGGFGPSYSDNIVWLLMYVPRG